jgi:hypothetical protein
MTPRWSRSAFSSPEVPLAKVASAGVCVQSLERPHPYHYRARLSQARAVGDEGVPDDPTLEEAAGAGLAAALLVGLTGPGAAGADSTFLGGKHVSARQPTTVPASTDRGPPTH